MESELANTTDFLTPSLDLRLGPSASYVRKRRTGTYFTPQGPATPGSTTTIKFGVSSSSEWLDPSSAMVSFIVNVAGANAHTFANMTPHCLFQRLMIRMSNQLVEDIDYYGRTVELV